VTNDPAPFIHMVTTILLSVLGLVLAFVLFQMFKPTPKPAISAAAPQALADSSVNLAQARKGDAISIVGAAADFSDLDFTVDRRSAYEANRRRWTDLSGDFRGNRVYLEVQSNPQLELMGLFDPRRLSLPDVGLSEDRLAELDERQDQSETIEFEGQRFNYHSSREVGFFENETGEGEGLYRWLFRDTKSARLICVEKWEGQPFDVRLAVRVNPSDVTVYRAA
jgi:hypothetical protein